MGMPITVEVTDKNAKEGDLEKVFSYFSDIDKRFSTYKPDSEISLFNKGKITEKDFSSDMKTVLALAEKTKAETQGYFDIFNQGKCDPSGIVKGWAILNAAGILKKDGFKNLYVEAGGDIQAEGNNDQGEKWRVGIRNPFNTSQIVKVVGVSNQGMVTSGSYLRGNHIYNPHDRQDKLQEIVSITVLGPDVLEADRYATAAFAMGKDGINFIEQLSGYEGYMINNKGIATLTTGFEKYILN